jgi:NAD(P)-dependent dehydrogenase (short-subunit alcohol dehydrogenase family)
MTKAIFITGSSSGLGRATALLFAHRGWTVFATMRHPEREKELGTVQGITLLRLDVTKPQDIDEAARFALARGPVDVVFANAGYALGGPLEAVTDAQLTQEVDTNLLGPIRTVKAFIPHFRERGAGVFLVTSSATGYVGMPLLSAYAATKFALEGWAEGLSYELPQGVHVKTIVPGSMKTGFLRSVDRAEHPAYATFAAKAERYYAAAAKNAADGTPNEVAESVWTAATDGKDQVAYFVTEESRQLKAAREHLGAEGFRANMRRSLDA